jgi:hypothetical protein
VLFVLDVALLHLQRLGAQEGCAVQRALRWLRGSALNRRRSARRQARLQHGGLHRDVALRLGHAFRHRCAPQEPISSPMSQQAVMKRLRRSARGRLARC